MFTPIKKRINVKCHIISSTVIILFILLTMTECNEKSNSIITSIGTRFFEPETSITSSYPLNCLFPTTPHFNSDSEASVSSLQQDTLLTTDTPVKDKSTTTEPFQVDVNQLFQEGTCQWNFTGFTYSILPDSTLNEYALYSPVSEKTKSSSYLTASMSTPWINGSTIISDTCKMIVEYRIANSGDPFEVVVDLPANQGSTVITEMRPSTYNDMEWSRKTIPLFKSQPDGLFKVIIELANLRPVEVNEVDVTYAAIRTVEFSQCFTSQRSSFNDENDKCYYNCDNNLTDIDSLISLTWLKVNTSKCINRNQMCNLIADCPDGQDEEYNCHLIPNNAKSTFINCKQNEDNSICSWENCNFNHGIYHKIVTPKYQGNQWILHESNSIDDINYIEAQFTSTANKYSDLAIIKSPVYNSIPFYHSNVSSKFFNSCQLSFQYLITKKSVSLVVKFVSPDLTLEESAHQLILLSTLEKSIGSFKHPLRLLPHIWELFSVFKGYSKSKVSHTMIHNDHQVTNNNRYSWSHVTVPLPMFVHSKYFIVIEANSGYSSGKFINSSSDTTHSIIAVTNITLSKECFAIDVPISEGIIHPYVKSSSMLYLSLCTIIFILLLCSLLVVFVLYRRNKLISSQSQYSNGTSDINELRSVGQIGSVASGSVSTATSRYAVNATYYACNSATPVTDLFNISHDQVICERKLGNGAFGEVFAGRLKCDLAPDLKAGFPVAIKTLHEHSDSYQTELDFTIEAQIMAKFNHRNIVRFIGVSFDTMPRMIILEFLEGKDVKEFLRKSRGTSNKPCPLNMGDLLVMALDVARGCEYLEAKHFIHRDIAARNCLLNRRHKLASSINAPPPDAGGFFNMSNYDDGFNHSGLITKIADFGMARDIYRADYYKKGGKAMIPVKWMPPECFLEGIFTSKTDVWAYGIFLWEVFSLGFMPYPGHSNHEVMDLVQRNERMKPPNSSTPGPVYALMLRCWQAVPDMRPSFSEIIRSIGLCLVDPDILNTPLPKFSVNGTGYSYDDQAIMRPPPDSTDYLVPSHTCSNSASNYSMSTEKTELLSPDSLSIRNAEEGRLLELDESIGGITVMSSHEPPPLPFTIYKQSGSNCILPTTLTTTGENSTLHSTNNGQVILNTNLIQPTNYIFDTGTINTLTNDRQSSLSNSQTTSNNSKNHNNNSCSDNCSLDQLNVTSLLSSASQSYLNDDDTTITPHVNTSQQNRPTSPNRYVNV